MWAISEMLQIKKRSASVQTKKLGSACPITDRKSAIRSIKLFGRIAAATQSGTDNTIANVIADTPKVIVVESRSAINALTSVLK